MRPFDYAEMTERERPVIGDDERERADVNLADQRRETGRGKLVDAGDGTNFVSFYF